jgi:hemerythrin-like domain-containing protein
MRPTQVLMEEHRVIERALNALEEVANRLDLGGDVSLHVLEGLLDFVRGFADRCHHHKEEDVLFPYLEKRGLPSDEGPLGVMLQEHEVGRRHVAAMVEAVENSRPEEFGAHARAYIELLREHITKEDNVLFPMADQMMAEEDLSELMGSFHHAEEELGSSHEGYLTLLEGVERDLGLV